MSEMEGFSDNNFSKRNKRKVSHPFPHDGLKREVTQSENMESSPLRKQDYDNTDKFYRTFNHDTRKNEDIHQQRRNFNSESPLVFQSTLSSLSKEDTSSDSLTESPTQNHSNKLSIFRPRREDAMPPINYDEFKDQNETMPNLLTSSDLSNTNHLQSIADIRFPNSREQSHMILKQVSSNMEKSFSYSSHDNYPMEVVVDQLKGQFSPNADTNSRRELVLRSDRKKQHDSRFNYSKKRKVTSEIDEQNKSQDYYQVLYSFRNAFVDFSFLLPGFESHVFRAIREQSDGNICNSGGPMELTPREITVARRRLHCAVCAFGGNRTKSYSQQTANGIQSHFKSKTDNANFSSSFNKSQRQLHYEQQLKLRYFENETRLSWDAEENPPVDNGQNAENGRNNGRNGFLQDFSTSNHNKSKTEKPPSLRSEETQRPGFKVESDLSRNDEEDAKRSSEAPKARYRCKLCGQPKQNHTCPYQQSLQRSIGTMTYSALNSHECSEPGNLAPTLTEMNNFFNMIDENQLDTVSSSVSISSHNLDTVDSFGKTIHKISPDAHLSKTKYKIDPTNTKSDNYILSLKTKKRKIAIKSSFVEKATDQYSNDFLLLDKVEMKPEQYRAVSVNQSYSVYGSYTYPSLPLTHSQRTCMSDSLFNLSKARFGLVDECSKILQEAQRTDLWDLAVAELLTQVLVVLHCPIGDNNLEGLRKYLLSLGISS